MIIPFFVPNVDAAVAQEIRRPIACISKYSPSKGAAISQVNAPTADISRFSESIPSVTKYKSQLIDVLYEANEEGYVKPEISPIAATIIAFDLIHKHRLSINSYSPIEEGGIALDLYFNQTYIHLQFDNEEDATVYIEEPGQDPKGWDLSFVDAFIKLESLLA